MDDIYKELQKLGFSQYECKAYIGLLKHSPITGYEISKRSGVPRSMIYEVIGKLLEKGAVYTVPSEPVTYAPLAARELIRRLRGQFEQSFDYLEKSLSALESEQEVDVIRRISGDELVLTEMRQMIKQATGEVWLSIWEPQVPAIQESVDACTEAGISVFTVLFGQAQTRVGTTYHHDYMAPDVAEERMGGHLTIVARDLEEVLIANFAPNTAAWAVKTKDPALVLVAVEYIRHDIMFAEVTKVLGPEKVETLWRNKPDLYQVVTGKSFLNQQ
ncbi:MULTISPECIES: TrmB family transcriptional regulator [Brevibacillus]|jgi:sugar-specific transcriptional regulator TrmB|uniref:Transcriptional regulator n=1 Tax=Brevibacillus parabrevis TaxID=54914 RepID=A0A4Y3PS53_BREPA|nr:MULTISPECIES: TrmB family transcriptional regulator [Brevibacillus]MBU8712533.1 TrmB family transcriptional regulator [Brevibacillus parabrevis]MDR5000150.1 helix-turn-helix domain-containing protein [Brevibacillus parabrevis]MED2256857.1 helix-turn-helix domain-containing protein [Brevibacillus parabrevis]NRQ56927.1 TrmB family transcriptional regulator [Brevibacillus sp. HD1.4A]RNB96398.1 TrmB family transcriptional regulator [Brevibacillus parabrevis]